MEEELTIGKNEVDMDYSEDIIPIQFEVHNPYDKDTFTIYHRLLYHKEEISPEELRFETRHSQAILLMKQYYERIIPSCKRLQSLPYIISQKTDALPYEPVYARRMKSAKRRTAFLQSRTNRLIGDITRLTNEYYTLNFELSSRSESSNSWSHAIQYMQPNMVDENVEIDNLVTPTAPIKRFLGCLQQRKIDEHKRRQHHRRNYRFRQDVLAQSFVQQIFTSWKNKSRSIINGLCDRRRKMIYHIFNVKLIDKYITTAATCARRSLLILAPQETIRNLVDATMNYLYFEIENLCPNTKSTTNFAFP